MEHSNGKMMHVDGKREIQALTDMLMGFQNTQIIYSAVKLGLLEELSRGDHPLTAAQVANKLLLDCDATERLLNSCVTIGLIKQYKNQQAVCYSSDTLMSKLLSKSSGMSLRPFVLQIGEMYQLWGALTDTIRNGQKEIGAFSAEIFNEESYHIKENQNIEFLKTMHLFSKQDSPHILKALDLSQFDKACDLGGGTGAFAQDLANMHPSMQVSVLELPHVVRVAKHFQDKHSQSPIEFIEGNFFTDPLPPSDLYILSHVLHDWDSDRIELLLSKIYDSLEKGGALVVLEKFLSDTKTAPRTAVMWDLSMLLGSQGRERSSDEYELLLRDAGFSNIHTKVTQAMHRDAILAIKT